MTEFVDGKSLWFLWFNWICVRICEVWSKSIKVWFRGANVRHKTSKAQEHSCVKIFASFNHCHCHCRCCCSCCWHETLLIFCCQELLHAWVHRGGVGGCQRLKVSSLSQLAHQSHQSAAHINIDLQCKRYSLALLILFHVICNLAHGHVLCQFILS